jgi:hypothetical protein
LPQFGKPDSYDSCDLVVLMNSDTIYRSSDGLLREKPAAKFKEWMARSGAWQERNGGGCPEPAAAGAAGTRAPK